MPKQHRKWPGVAAALVVGALIVVGIVILAKSGTFAVVGTLLAGVVVAVVAAVNKEGKVSPLLLWAALGGVVGIPVSFLISYIFRPSTTPALQSIAPHGESYRDIGANGEATFDITVPPGFTKLYITFYAQNSQGANDNCVDGSSLTVSTVFKAVWGGSRTLPENRQDEIEIPGGVSNFQIVVQFKPQQGYDSCHEEIQVASSAYFAR